MTKITFGNNKNIAVENIYISNKSERQEVGIIKWNKSHGKGLLNYVPRFGKTRTALMIIEKLFDSSKHFNKNVLIVAPNITVAKQWEFNINTFGFKNHKEKIDVVTRNLLNMSLCNKAYLLTIYDEVHKYVTTDKTYGKMIKQNEMSKFLLSLTGSLPNDKIQLNRILEMTPIVDVITEDEAIENKWIAPYKEYNIPLDFPADIQREYYKYSEFITDTLNLFRGSAKLVNNIKVYKDIYFGFKSDYDVLTACYTGRKDLTSNRYIQPNEVRDIVAKSNGWNVTLNLHDNYDKQIEEYWSPDAIFRRAKTFNEFVRLRKELIDTHRDKLKAILAIIKDSINKETIIYTASIDFAEEIASTINRIHGDNVAITYHSKVPSKPLIDPSTGDFFRYKSGAKKGLPKVFGQTLLKKHYIEGIKQGVHKILVTVESLNEGLDIPNLKRVISIAGTRNAITHKQRTARVKTIDQNDLLKEGKVYNIFFNDFLYKKEYIKSVDKTKLLLRQSNNINEPEYMELKIN